MSLFAMNLSKNKIYFYSLLVCFFTFSTVLVFAGFKKHHEINILVDRCLIESSDCQESLMRIHSYQVEAASAKDFPCQTRLLGLEANLIMAMNNNLKRNKIYNSIESVKKYC